MVVVESARRGSGALVLARAMVLGMSSVAATADDVNLTPGSPTIVRDANSPTGYASRADRHKTTHLQRRGDLHGK